jgi:DNA-binding transcriptional ArsR family regulator
MPTDTLSRVFAALGDPTRRDMVARLAAADATVNELAEPYRMSLQAVYKHLRVLEEAGLVSRPAGRQPRSVSPPGRGALPAPRPGAGRDEGEERRA